MQIKGYCRDCDFCIKIQEDPEDPTIYLKSECHRFPPTTILLRETGCVLVSTVTNYPEVAELDYCGEFKDRIKMEKKRNIKQRNKKYHRNL